MRAADAGVLPSIVNEMLVGVVHHLGKGRARQSSQGQAVPGSGRHAAASGLMHFSEVEKYIFWEKNKII